MKSLESILLLALLLSLTSCMKIIMPSGTDYSHIPSEIDVLKNECADIRSEGSIMDLLQEIKLNHQEILYLIGLPDPINEVPRIREVANSIKIAGEKISSLARPVWSISKWNRNVTWVIDEENFKSTLGTYIPNGFKIQDASIHSVFFMGDKNNSIKSNISISHDKNRVEIKLSNQGSSLDICELQKSLFIVVEVQYKNIKWRKKQYFSLNMKEFERSI